MITCIHQRDDRITHFNVPVKRHLIDIICGYVDYGSTIYTDEYVQYNQLKVHGLVHEQVKHSVKEYARWYIQKNNCEYRSNLFKIWIAKFTSVNKYNLQAYSKAFELIHNICYK
jgi:transposase-like protein